MKIILSRIFCIAVICTMNSSHAIGDIKALVESSSYYIKNKDGNSEWITPINRTVDYPPEGVSLGQGWDSFRDAKMQGQCIQFSAEEAGGQVARVETKRIFDSDSLRHSLSLSYSAAAGAKFGIGGGEASVKSSFLSSSEVNNQYLNLLVKGEVQNGVSFVSPAKTPNGMIELTAFAKDLLKGKDGRSAFIAYCGDSFVATIERGAELYALYQFSSSDRKDKSEKVTSISASANYMAFSGSASTSESSTLEVLANKQISGLKYLHTAHRGLRLPYNEDSINSSLTSLGSAQELADAQPYRLKLVRYDSLPGWKQAKLRSGSATREALVALYYRLNDLRETAIDIERNPQKYNLTYAADVIAKGTLRNILDKRISELVEVLSKCEEKKQAGIDEDARNAVLRKCTTTEEDVTFSDYPYRALMPIQTVRVSLAPAVNEQKAILQKKISDLQQAFSNAVVINLPLNPMTCSKFPQAPQCAAISNQINVAQAELSNFLKQNEFRNIAESRYAYWIEEISRARGGEGVINGYLSSTELAMFRREIYCQYGTSPDSAQCPETTLIQLLHDGALVRKVIQVNLDETGETKSSPPEAWKSIQDKLTQFLGSKVRHKLHYFELTDPIYSSISAPDNPGATAFNLKGKASIIYFDHDPAEIKKLLTPP